MDVKHEIVHNRIVCDALREKGAIFVEEVAEVQEGETSASSRRTASPPSVREDAKRRKLYTIDATCPLVTKIHIELNRFTKEGKEIIYIGHRGHPEAVGVMGVRPGDNQLVDGPGGGGEPEGQESGQPGLPDPDHAVDRRCMANNIGAQEEVPEDKLAAFGRHMLRHHQQAGRHKGRGKEVRHNTGRRQQELIELEQARGDLQGSWGVDSLPH